MKHCKDVGPGDVCGCWAMSRQFEMAGRSQGRVKHREYLMYLVAVREEERLEQLIDELPHELVRQASVIAGKVLRELLGKPLTINH